MISYFIRIAKISIFFPKFDTPLSLADLAIVLTTELSLFKQFGTSFF